MTNEWSLCGPWLPLSFIDKKSFISSRLSFECYEKHFIPPIALPISKPWISITVVEMHWNPFKEGCCKKCRILDITLLSRLLDFLKTSVWAKSVFRTLRNASKRLRPCRSQNTHNSAKYIKNVMDMKLNHPWMSNKYTTKFNFSSFIIRSRQLP